MPRPPHLRLGLPRVWVWLRATSSCGSRTPFLGAGGPPGSGGAQAGLCLAAPCKLQVGSLKALSSLLRPFLPQNLGILGEPELLGALG